MHRSSTKDNLLNESIRDINQEIGQGYRDVNGELPMVDDTFTKNQVRTDGILMLQGRMIDPKNWIIIALPLDSCISQKNTSQRNPKNNSNHSLDEFLN